MRRSPARPRHHRHESTSLTHALDLAEVGIKLGAELRSNQLPQGNLQNFFNAVPEHPRRSGIHRQQPACKIVNAQQILAVLD
jgi:hypothetical protein